VQVPEARHDDCSLSDSLSRKDFFDAANRNVAVLVGSLRKDSYNRKMAQGPGLPSRPRA
jgi:hypothetical protein